MQMPTNKIIDKIELFTFYKLFFSDTDDWHMLSDSAKMQHAFMLTRLIAIKHPEYIQCFNNFHSVHVINGLHDNFKSKGRQPSWAYTKTTNKKSNDLDVLSKYPAQIIQYSEVIAELDKELAAWSQSEKPKTLKKKK